jgi:hypothetical protein
LDCGIIRKKAFPVVQGSLFFFVHRTAQEFEIGMLQNRRCPRATSRLDDSRQLVARLDGRTCRSEAPQGRSEAQQGMKKTHLSRCQYYKYDVEKQFHSELSIINSLF